MGVYDQAARYAVQADPDAVVERLAGPTLRFADWLDARSTPRPGDADRTADHVARLEGDVIGRGCCCWSSKRGTTRISWT